MISDAFQEPEYTEDTTFNTGVRNQVTNILGSGGGTVTRLNQGQGISLAPNPIQSTGVISLYASLDDLNDINITNPQLNEVLLYNGNSWVNSTSDGTSQINFTSLNDVAISNLSTRSNQLIVVNSSGTSLTSTVNNYKNNIIAGSGIQVIDSTNSARILFDSDSLNIATTNGNGDQFIIRNSSNEDERIAQGNIDVSKFSNSTAGYITVDNIGVSSPLTRTAVGNGISIGISIGELPSADMTNVTGILPIIHGGTGAGTSAAARSNLELVYNVDILSQSGPSFDNTLFGDQIHLQPSQFGLSLLSAGTGYTDGTLDLVLSLSGYENITANFTVAGTSITSLNTTSFSARGNYPDGVTVWEVVGTGSGGSVQLTSEDFYFNMSGLSGSDGLGLRNINGNLQFRGTSGTSWRQLFPFDINDIEEFDVNSPSSADLLIYNGTSWINRGVSGFVTINSAGTTTYTGGTNAIPPDAILANGASITSFEYGGLSGLTGNIQQQLDEKIGTTCVGAVLGDLIYYDNSGPSFWQPLSIGASNQILTSGDGTSIPEYNYLREILVASTSTSAAMEIPVLASSGPDNKITASNILLEFASGASFGIGMDNSNTKLALEIDKLNSGTSLISNDLIAFYDNSASTTNNVTVDNFCDSITGFTLSSNAGKINLRDTIFLAPQTFATSPSGAEGDLAYFNDGDAGSPCLGVYLGSCWHVVSIGSSIST